jgi:3-hydroxyisobutyrate dehydrogenase
MARVAFLGLGRMGRGMAMRLLSGGHDLAVFNRTPEKAHDVVAAGARWGRTPREAAGGADAVFAMVADDVASAAVWEGRDGALAADLAPRAFVIECSTLSHDRVSALASAAASRSLRFLDSPVTGLPEAAAAGQLTLLVGADDDDLRAAEPLLQHVAAEWLHFGPPGSGTAYKLMINLMGAVQIAAVAEVVRAIGSSQAASPQVVRNSRRMADGDHATDIVFSGRLRHKDALYGVRLAEKLGISAPLGEAALRGLERLLAAGLGEQNESSIIELARRGGR